MLSSRKASVILVGLGLGLLGLHELLALPGLLTLAHRVGLHELLGHELLALARRVGLRELLGLGLLGLGLLGRPTRRAQRWASPRATLRRACTHVFPARLREEWGGDFVEQQWQWHHQGYARWLRRLYSLGWALQLVGAYVWYKASEVVFAKYWAKFSQRGK